MKNKYIRIIVFSLIIYAILFGFYVATSNGLGNKPFYLQMRRFIPMTFICVLTTSILAAKVCQKYFLSFGIVSATWMLTYPILHKLTFSQTVPFFSNHFDIVFAFYSFVGLTALSFFFIKSKFRNNLALFMSLLQTVLMILPVLELAYYFYYGNCITEVAVLSAYQTNPNEAKEFILQTFGYGGILGSIIVLLAIFIGFLTLNTTGFELKDATPYSKKVIIYLLLVGLGGTGYAFSKSFKDTGIMTLNNNVRTYFHSITEFNEIHKKTFANLEVSPNKPALKEPSTIILVMGECASRSYMSAYTSTKNDTTPWLRERRKDSDFIVFDNVYTSRVNTVLALERALTEKNQYNEKEFKQCATIVDIAKKAGYHTTWFSNQGTSDVSDTPIAIIGKTADTSKWTNEDLTSSQYDGTLLKYLQEVDPKKNNFIVLHFMGSHDNYQNRYPKEFAKWGNPKINQPALNYDNSLLYSDYVLSEIHKYAKENLNLKAMLYFSDHGTVPDVKRNADMNDFTALRIPMFLYLSPDYQVTYPETTKVLKEHQQQYFTNDLAYELICGLLNIKSNRYDETQSFASDKYKYTRETLRTDLGTKKLTDDE